jgi:hypothetical protein
MTLTTRITMASNPSLVHPTTALPVASVPLKPPHVPFTALSLHDAVEFILDERDIEVAWGLEDAEPCTTLQAVACERTLKELLRQQEGSPHAAPRSVL